MFKNLIRAAGRSWFGIVAVLVVASACAGCGSSSPVAPVRGKVLLDDKPLATGAVVTLPPAGRGAKGAIHDGEFKLSTFGTNDGALLGTHKVAVVANEPPRAPGPEAGPGKLLVPQRYTNPDTSGLTIDVQAGETNEPVLELSSE